MSQRSSSRVVYHGSKRQMRGRWPWIVVARFVLVASALAIRMTAPSRGRRQGRWDQPVNDLHPRQSALASGSALDAPPARTVITAPVEVVAPGTRSEPGRPARFMSGARESTRSAFSGREKIAVHGSTWFAAGAGSAIAAAEFVTMGHPVAGMMLHVVIFLVLTVIAAATASDTTRGFALALALAPMVRIVSLGIPPGQFDELVSSVIVGTPLFAAAFAVVRALGLTPADINLRLPVARRWPLSLVIALSGVCVGGVEFVLLRPPAISMVETPRQLLLTIVALTLVTGFLEEFIFRGVIQTATGGIMTRGPAIVYGAGIFGVLHLGQGPLLHVAFVTIVGIAFGWFVVWTNSLYPVAIAHGLANVMLFVVLPLRFG